MSLPHEFSPDLPADAERKPAVILQHPRAAVTFDPSPVDKALGTAKDGFCSACGVSNRKHIGVTGTWLGCEVATYVKRQSDYPRDPQRWNDPYPAITAAVRAAMVDGSCGPHFEIVMAGFLNDEQLTIAHTLVRVAIAEYIRGLSK